MPHQETIHLHKINEIIASKDPVQRNLQITQTYSDINRSLTKLFGDKNVSWCAYAAWASKTAGKFIRKDNIDHAIEDFIRKGDSIQKIVSKVPALLKRLGGALKFENSFLVKALNDVAGEMSREVAEGNLLVFKELAPLYFHLLESIPDSGGYRPEVLEKLLSFIDSDKVEAIRKDNLKQAYTAYYQAAFEKDSKKKAELILYANLLVGYHEQIRLDKAINGSIESPIEKLLEEKIVFEIAKRIEASAPPFFFWLVKFLVVFRVRPAIQQIAAQWRKFATEQFMRIEIPDGNLDLSEDIPLVPYLKGGVFPMELEKLDYEPLIKLLEMLDYTPNTTQGSAALDWGNLADRMNFIVDFFRSEQQDRNLFRPTFTAAQMDIIRKGGIPDGPL